jgi:hypothetical protein
MFSTHALSVLPHTHHEPLLDLLFYRAVELAGNLPFGGTHPPRTASLLLLLLLLLVLLLLLHYCF